MMLEQNSQGTLTYENVLGLTSMSEHGIALAFNIDKRRIDSAPRYGTDPRLCEHPNGLHTLEHGLPPPTQTAHIASQIATLTSSEPIPMQIEEKKGLPHPAPSCSTSEGVLCSNEAPSPPAVSATEHRGDGKAK